MTVETAEQVVAWARGVLNAAQEMPPSHQSTYKGFTHWPTNSGQGRYRRREECCSNAALQFCPEHRSVLGNQPVRGRLDLSHARLGKLFSENP